MLAGGEGVGFAVSGKLTSRRVRLRHVVGGSGTQDRHAGPTAGQDRREFGKSGRDGFPVGRLTGHLSAEVAIRVEGHQYLVQDQVKRYTSESSRWYSAPLAGGGSMAEPASPGLSRGRHSLPGRATSSRTRPQMGGDSAGVGLRLPARGRRWEWIRPGWAASFRTRPQMKEKSPVKCVQIDRSRSLAKACTSSGEWPSRSCPLRRKCSRRVR